MQGLNAVIPRRVPFKGVYIQGAEDKRYYKEEYRGPDSSSKALGN